MHAIIGQQSGQVVPRKLTVPGSDASGLPAAHDGEVLVALLQRYAKVGRGGWRIIIIQRAPRASGKPRKAVRPEPVQELEGRGVTPATAEALVEAVPAERIRLKLEVFDWLVARRDRRIAKSPAGHLSSYKGRENLPFP